MDELKALSLAARMEKAYSTLPPREQRVAKFVLGHPEKVLSMSVTALAQQTRTSDATVVRFCQRLGYDGYREFRIRVARELRTAGPTAVSVNPDDRLTELVAMARDAAVAAVQTTCNELDFAELERAADAMAAARRVDFYGAGESAVVASDAHMKFLRLGIIGMAHMNAHMQAMSATLTTAGDVAVAISHSGATRDTVDALACAKEAGATTLAITGLADMPIEAYADIVLYARANEDFGRGSFAARLAQLTVLDILFVAVAQRLGDDAAVTMEKARRALVRKIFGTPSSDQ